MKTKFKVGDIVRIVGSPEYAGTYREDYVDEVGEILHAHKDVDREYYLVGIGDTQLFWDVSELEPAPIGFETSCPKTSLKEIEINEDDKSTTIYWTNGDTTRVVCHDEDKYDWEKGIALAVMKYAFGNTSEFNDIFHQAESYMKTKVAEELKTQIEEALDEIYGKYGFLFD